MPQTASLSVDTRPVVQTSPVRPRIALAVAAVVFGSGLYGILPFILVLPLTGVILALGAPPDHVGAVRPIARRPRNVVLGAVLVAALAAVVGQPQLTVPLVTLFGPDGSSLAVTCAALVALALPLAMVNNGAVSSPTPWFVLTRRNLILSLTVFVVVASWYGDRGLSLIPIGVFVLSLPLIIGISRLVGARTQRLEYGLLRHPLRAGLGPQRLQLVNEVLLCGLLALTLPTGVYDPAALQLTPGVHRVFVVAFVLGLTAFLILALVPLRHVRLGSNLLVAAGTVFLAAQLIAVYRPPVDAVTVGSPLAEEWWVGHGGHAELTNYHQASPTQRHAVDIMQVVDGSIHRSGSTDLASYYIYDKPVLAPADGTVTYVVDGHLDLPVGTLDSQHPTGNQVVLDVGGGRYLLMGHLRQGSVAVKVGDQVTEGQQLARVGNSGNSSHPHIHIQAQTLPTGIADVTTVDVPQLVKTLRTYPLLFRGASLVRNGVETRPEFVDPRRGDFVRPTR